MVKNTSMDENRIIPLLQVIQPKQEVVYHIGPDSRDLSPLIRKKVHELVERNRIRTHLRRVQAPTCAGKVNHKLGTGRFEYLAVGR